MFIVVRYVLFSLSAAHMFMLLPPWQN